MRRPAGLRATRHQWVPGPRPAPGGLLRPHPGHHRQYTQQPDRQGLLARRADRHRRVVSSVRRAGTDRRDLRTHLLRRRAHSLGYTPGHARPDRDRQRLLQDLQHHRVAHRDDRGAGSVDRRHQKSARLSDRRSAGPAPGGCGFRSRGSGAAVLRSADRRLPRPTRCAL